MRQYFFRQLASVRKIPQKIIESELLKALFRYCLWLCHWYWDTLTQTVSMMIEKAEALFWDLSHRVKVASTVITAMVNAMKVSMTTLPVVLSFFPVVAAIPILGQLLPPILLHSYAVWAIITGVTLVVGYAKYKEISMRQQLDAQVRNNTEQAKTHALQMEKQTNIIDELHQKIEAFNEEKDVLSEEINVFRKEIDDLKARTAEQNETLLDNPDSPVKLEVSNNDDVFLSDYEAFRPSSSCREEESLSCEQTTTSRVIKCH